MAEGYYYVQKCFTLARIQLFVMVKSPKYLSVSESKWDVQPNKHTKRGVVILAGGNKVSTKNLLGSC